MSGNAIRLAEQDANELTSGLSREAVGQISNELRQLLADTFTLYIKTKNFHWHLSGAHFRDYHLLLDEHADQIFAIADDIAERARKIGGTTIRSIGDIAKNQRLKDNDQVFVTAGEMLRELREDNRNFINALRATHASCEKYEDVATASFIEVWIDQAERRHWFLTEIVREL
jgi:starvation-inducible DNA-binding protein